MFGLFKKKTPVYPTDGRWSVAQSERNGKPMFVRRNESAGSLAGHVDYKFRVGIAIPLKNPNSDGLPSNSEMEQLNVIEDELCEGLEREQASLQVLSITSHGMREFVFYTRSPSLASAAIEGLREKTQTHEIQSYVAEDPQWQVYAQFA